MDEETMMHAPVLGACRVPIPDPWPGREGGRKPGRKGVAEKGSDNFSPWDSIARRLLYVDSRVIRVAPCGSLAYPVGMFTGHPADLAHGEGTKPRTINDANNNHQTNSNTNH